MILMLTLFGGMAVAQVSIMDIPALPQGISTPKPVAPTAPATGTPTPAQPTTDQSATTLPNTGKALAGSYTVNLTGPDTVQAGEANTWSFNLTNNGQANIHLEHGACDVRFEVLNAAGEVVRPDPKLGICTLQLVIFDAAAGATEPVQNIRWDGKDGAGKAVPAGEYTIRAKFAGSGVFTTPATLTVTVQ